MSPSSTGRATRLPGHDACDHLVENIGSGPALNVECSLQLVDAEPGRVPATQTRIAGLAVGDLEPFLLDSYGIPVVLDFALTVEYEDVAGKSWKTSCRYVNKRYEAVTIDLQAV